MPRIVPPGQMLMATEELSDSVKETIKKAHQTLDAAAAAQILKGLGIGSNGSSAKDMGEVISAAATSLKNAGELQTSLINQMAELITRGKDDDSLKEMMNKMLLMKMMESLTSSQKTSPELEKFLELLKEENRRLREEIRELKENRGPSPVEQHMQSLTTQLLSQHIASLTDPFAGLQRLAKAKEELKNLFSEPSNVPPEYSEGALRLRALEKEEKALAVEENKFLAQLNYRERMLSQQIPALIQQAGAVLANVLGAYGLTPVRPLQFDGDASAEAEKLAGEGS